MVSVLNTSPQSSQTICFSPVSVHVASVVIFSLVFVWLQGATTFIVADPLTVQSASSPLMSYASKRLKDIEYWPDGVPAFILTLTRALAVWNGAVPLPNMILPLRLTGAVCRLLIFSTLTNSNADSAAIDTLAMAAFPDVTVTTNVTESPGA